ncbi:unnamed protein product [Musa textilis]
MLSVRPSSPPPCLAGPPPPLPRPCPARRLLPCVAVASATGQRGRRRGDDDYHATIRSLNSRGGHTPRKSLGQVRTRSALRKVKDRPVLGPFEVLIRLVSAPLFAQHYMLNSSVNEELVRVAGVGEGDVVLEIGPGTGSLTNVLIDAGATVVAIEKDPHMATLVQERFRSTDQLMVLQEDFTKCHIHSHLSSLLEKNHKESSLTYAKVVSNLPFNISTEVVKQLLPMGDVFSDVVLLLQDEAASRLADCSLRTPEYRPINIFVKFYSDPAYIIKVERTNFFPQPNVDAAIIRFRLKRSAEYPLVASPKSFFSMVNSAFNGKRKMLRKSLQHICPSVEIEAALITIGQPVTARPEELTLDDFVSLHNLIARV